MKLFYVCSDPGIAPDGTKGASVHLRSIARALAGEGHSVELLTRRRPEDESALPCRWHDLEGIGSVAALAARIGRPDAILERYSLGSTAGLAAARELSLPFALEVNAPLVLEAREHRPDKVTPEHEDVESRLFRESDLLGVVSRPLLEFVTSIRGRPSGVTLLRNGCDPALFEPRDVETARDAAAPLLGFLGNPKPWHGADLLPAILTTLEQAGTSARARIVGGGPGAHAVLAEAERLGIGDRIEITGALPQAEAIAHFSEVSIALAPYPEREFFYFCPLKVLESMAAGLPIVASRIGDIPEILGETGRLVPAGDVGAIAEAILDLAEDPTKRERLGAAARARALARFTWQDTARRLTDRIEALVRNREPAR